MPGSDSYGDAFGKRLGAQATSFATRALPRATIAVTELCYKTPQNILSTPPIAEDAFMVAVHLRHFPRYEYWENGKAAPISVLRPGETIIYDLKRQPTFHLNSSFHSVHFYFPRAALDALADEASAPRIDELHYKPAVSHQDPILRGIADALGPLFVAPHQANRLLMDHLMLTVGHHVASRYGGMRPVTQRVFGGLTLSQERRAKELLTDNLSGDVPLSTLARECGLSLTSFSRAFRKSVGLPPHRWVIQQRINLAKLLLRDGPMSLAEIAIGMRVFRPKPFYPVLHIIRRSKPRLLAANCQKVARHIPRLDVRVSGNRNPDHLSRLGPEAEAGQRHSGPDSPVVAGRIL